MKIIVDGHNHFFKTLYSIKNFTKGKALNTKKDKEIYMRKIATDLTFSIRLFESITRIVFVSDNYSWRKDVEIIENDGYKANRKKDDDSINWNNFKEINNEFFEILKSKNFITSNISGCEGDDLMYFWAEELYNRGEDVIIFSSDADITQLVKYNDNNFICVFNPNSTNRKLYSAKGFKSWLNNKINEPIDVFESLMNLDFNSSTKNIILKIINLYKFEEINPEDVIFNKIIIGDEGDNIPPILTWQSEQKSGRIINNKISLSKAKIIKEKIISKYNEIDLYNLSNYIEIFKDVIKESYKKDINEDLIKSRIERNTKLIYLNENFIPLELQNKFKKHKEQYKNIGSPNIESMNMKGILEGTQYYKESSAIESDIFSNIKPETIINKNNKSLF